ncbi:hypothetical protein FHS62_001166 [Amphiplicatus metriothermophilus]|nr:hypothetical protein [Amphiplicatus metriothermophilus]
MTHQRGFFRGAALDFAGHAAREPAVLDFEYIGVVEIESRRCCDAACKIGEAAGHERRMGPEFLHGANKDSGAGRQGDPIAENLLKRLFGKARKHGKAFRQRAFKIDLAAHRPLCDGDDLRALAGDAGKLVDALLFDDGGIHVGHEKPLAAGFGRLRNDVDRRAGEGVAHIVCKAFEISGAPRGQQVAGDAFCEAALRDLSKTGVAHSLARAVDNRLIKTGRGRIANQRYDSIHIFRCRMN